MLIKSDLQLIKYYKKNHPGCGDLDRHIGGLKYNFQALLSVSVFVSDPR